MAPPVFLGFDVLHCEITRLRTNFHVIGFARTFQQRACVAILARCGVPSAALRNCRTPAYAFHPDDIRTFQWTLTEAAALVHGVYMFLGAKLFKAWAVRPLSNPTDFVSMVNAEHGQLERYLVSREDFLELVVPPCSSRVAYHTGYGVALFNKPVGAEATFDYAVLWTPIRALHRWGYAVVIIYGFAILALPLAQLARFRWAWRKNFMR
ncbi:hypothetical protein HPB51_006357 [Rhipicephalus microplus]|uniref:Uncharacterized protein n=1 Tax=Rhipicephalus microplus TaxID=6941 RepID=A0A9J6DLJ3_RHIMP|nr:hypothetical protein HPB51_006357 [Rhipicephalus microplus]